MEATQTKSLFDILLEDELIKLKNKSTPRDNVAFLEPKARYNAAISFEKIFILTFKNNSKSFTKEELAEIILKKRYASTFEEAFALIEPHLPNDTDKIVKIGDSSSVYFLRYRSVANHDLYILK